MTSNSIGALTALKQVELKKGVSITEIRSMGLPPISGLVKQGDKSECYLLIEAMIILLNKYYAITWTEFQLTETSREFYSQYFYWSQLDLKNFIGMCKRMEFEKLLSVNQFSPMMFMSWAAIYDSRWVHVSEELAHLEKDRTNYDPARETEIYNREVRLKVDERTKDDRIQSMQYIIEKQNKIIKDLNPGS